MPSWTNPTSASWSDATKWTGGVANGAGVVADFTVSNPGSGTAFILFSQNDLFTVGTLNIVTDSDDGWLFRGDVGVTSATLRFLGSGGGPAFLNIDTNGSSRPTTIGTFGLTVNLGSDLILNTINSDTTLLLSAKVTGSRDLYKFGDGVLSMTGSNASWTGDLLLRGGRTELVSGSAPNGGTIEFDNGAALIAGDTIGINNAIETRSGDSRGVIAATTGNTLTLTGLLRLRSDDSNAVTFGTAADQGTVTLSGTSSIDGTGGFNIAGGTLRFGTAGAAANYFTGLSSTGFLQVASGATLDTRGFITTITNLDLDGGTLTSSLGVLDVTVNDTTFNNNSQSGNVTGTAGVDRIVINVTSTFQIGPATFSNWTNGTDTITLIGNGADNTISGSTQNDTINGGGGADNLIGNGGNDVLDGGLGADQLQGGQGNDAYIIDNAGDVVTEAAAQGTDLVFTSINYTLTSEVERLAVNGSTTTFAVNLTGNGLANEITGNNGANIIDGGGNADIMSGLGGNDSYFVDNAGDVVVELLNQGTDTIFTSVNFTLDHDIENLSVNGLGTTNAINLTGNELVNLITGNNGANVIDGKAGADTMSGLGGDDIYFVDVAGDAIIEGSGGGFDTVFTTFNYTLSDDIERVAVNGATTTFAIDLTGNARANEISGNDGSNVLAGQGGSDILIGNGGADTFAFTSSIFAGSIDQIADFQVGLDKIGLDDGEFAGLSLGLLPAAAFRSGAAAQDADDRIIYNPATGALFFDADGNGAGAAVQFANLSNGLALTANDFQVI